VILPRDERIHVDSSRRAWARPFERHDRLDPESFYGYSGHHGVTGILAAAGPGIRLGDVPSDAEITQIPATLLALHGLGSRLDAGPIEAILDPSLDRDEAVPAAAAESQAAAGSVYTEEEEARMIERLRDLGYE
jgi:hypothetical protein